MGAFLTRRAHEEAAYRHRWASLDSVTTAGEKFEERAFGKILGKAVSTSGLRKFTKRSYFKSLPSGGDRVMPSDGGTRLLRGHAASEKLPCFQVWELQDGGGKVQLTGHQGSKRPFSVLRDNRRSRRDP